MEPPIQENIEFAQRKIHPMLTVAALLVLAAFIVTIAAATGRAPLWVAVLLLVLIDLVRLFPVQ
jgi:hypothetical protein